MFHSTGTGRYVASERDVVYRRRAGKAGERLVLRVPGHDATALTELLGSVAEHDAVTAKGLTMIEADWNGNRWGDATAQGRLTSGKNYAQGAPWSALAGAVLGIGRSMGATNLLNWARNNPTLVSAVVLMIPAVDIQDIHANNRGGFAAEIAAIYGGVPPDANTPAKNAASYSGLPMKIYYSNDDPICTPSTVTAFAASVGAAAVNLGNVGHATTGIDLEDVASFLAAHA